MKIYLAGYISGNKIKECTDWRKKIREHYDYWKGGSKYPICWLDPLNGKNFGEIDKTGLKSDIPGKAFVYRDFKCVAEADLIIVNTDTFGESRPLTGTVFELAWAWYLKKPVILISTEDNYRFHPFVVDTATLIVPSVEELLEKKYVNYFYKGTVSAQYE